MAVSDRGSTTTVKILGKGDFSGSIADVEGFSANEDATPTNWDSLSGGVGDITFSVQEDPSATGSILLTGQEFELYDPFAGTQRGFVENSSVKDGQLQVRASSRAVVLVAERTAVAYTGTVGGALTYYFALCGMTTGFAIDPTIGAIPITLPSWKERVWDQIRKLAVIYRFEVATVSGVVVVRPLRQRTVEMRKLTEVSHSFGLDNAVKEVHCYYYNNTWQTAGQAWPDPLTAFTERTIISVDAGETKETSLSVNAWLDTLTVPLHVDHLAAEEPTLTRTTYAIVDKEGVMVTVEDWRNGGGMLTTEIGKDGKSVIVKVRGMITQDRAPYKIASASEDGEYEYPALWVIGKGTFFQKNIITGLTGAGPAVNPTDDVFVIDDPMISTAKQAVAILTATAQRKTGLSQTVSMSSTAVNRRGDTGLFLYPTFNDYEATVAPGQNFNGFDALWAGKNFDNFDEAQEALVRDDFANQAFGGIAGSRVLYRDAWYRVTSGTVDEEGFTWDAEFDTLHSDFDGAWAGSTFDGFDTQWSGYEFEHFEMSPLYRA